MLQDMSAVIIDCEFKHLSSHWGVDYACSPLNFRTTLDDRNVTQVKGLHDAGKKNEDVKKLFVKKQSCHYLPLNIGSHFINLETLYIMNSNVQHLLDGDLDGLTNLRVFDVSHNPIQQLGENFFKGHDTIEVISFYDCHLKMIHPSSLNPLKNLREAHFQQNVCIDIHGDDISEMQDLKAEIADKCQSEHNELIFNRDFVVENSPRVSSEETLSFTKKNANIIISVLVFLLLSIGVVFGIIIRRTFTSWDELKNTLI